MNCYSLPDRMADEALRPSWAKCESSGNISRGQ